MQLLRVALGYHSRSRIDAENRQHPGPFMDFAILQHAQGLTFDSSGLDTTERSSQVPEAVARSCKLDVHICYFWYCLIFFWCLMNRTL